MEKEKTKYSEVVGVKAVEIIDIVSKTLTNYGGKNIEDRDSIDTTVLGTVDTTEPPKKVNDIDKSPNGVYLEWENKRMVIKDAFFTLSCIGFIIFACYIAYYKDAFIAPSLTYPDGTHLTGNCSFIWAEFEGMQELSKAGMVLPDSFKTTGGGIFIDPQLDNKTVIVFDPTTTTVTTVETTTTTLAPENCTEPEPCPDCKCAASTPCPSCECPYESGLSKKQIRKSLNIRPGSNNSPAYSAGCFQCLKDNWIVIDIPLCDGSNDNYCRPKYKLSSSSGYYGEITAPKPAAGLFCFKDLGGYFIVNRTAYEQGEGKASRQMFGWNDDNCHSSALRVNDL